MAGTNPSIGIYQPLFNEAIREYLDPGFITLDWLHNPSPELRELALHHHILQSRLFERHDLTGLLSPKFFSKTGLTSREVKDWIKQNPGHEIYCFDGRPFGPATRYNTVEQVLSAIRGLKMECDAFVAQSDLICLPNWVAKPANKRLIAIFGALVRAFGSAGAGKSYCPFSGLFKATHFWRAKYFAKRHIALQPRSF